MADEFRDDAGTPVMIIKKTQFDAVKRIIPMNIKPKASEPETAFDPLTLEWQLIWPARTSIVPIQMTATPADRIPAYAAAANVQAANYGWATLLIPSSLLPESAVGKLGQIRLQLQSREKGDATESWTTKYHIWLENSEPKKVLV